MSHPSLAGRAALAVLLFIGFYALALGIAGALLYIPYVEVTYLHRINFNNSDPLIHLDPVLERPA
jgi:uncharacterized membrane protein YbaN (DUF454 family)